MPEALPTFLLFALFWATMGASFVRLRWRASFDQLSVLWLMTVFGFGLMAPVMFGIFGWKVALGFSALAAAAPGVAYRYHLGGISPDRSQRWSVSLYAVLLLASATVVALNAATFVRDLESAGGLSATSSTAVLLLCVLAVGLAGVVSALQLKVGGKGGDV